MFECRFGFEGGKVTIIRGGKGQKLSHCTCAKLVFFFGIHLLQKIYYM